MSPAAGSGNEDRPVVVRPDGTRARGEKDAPAPGAGLFGMALFLASLSMLFGASLVAYAIIRFRADEWRPEGVSTLPPGIWISTLMLVGVSVFMQRALNDVRGGKGQRLVSGLFWTLAFALAFLFCQTWNGVRFHDASILYETSLYGFTFYMLTGLHAAHVLGGLGGLGWVIHRARKGDYTWAYYPGVRYMTIYWHYLGVVWLILFVVLVVGSL